MTCILLILALSLVSQLSATQRTLTDTQGRSIDVELIAKTDKGVLVIRKVDGSEFEIAYDLLSQADREFLSQWKPPAPETPENPLDAVVIMRSEESSEKGYGSGFFAHSRGKTYVYTNQHVISDINDIEAVDSRGKKIDLGHFEISNSQDLARFRVSPRPALMIKDNVASGERITALGNSEGAGVITAEKGTVQGIGPKELEVSTKFVPGNSGGPVVNEDSMVVGVATYLTLGDKKPEWVKKDTRYSKNRRFCVRPSRIDDWRAIEREEYENQTAILDAKMEKFDQAYWAFQMLSERTGYVSTIPEKWEKAIKDILHNHNARQKRPNRTVTRTYDTYGNLSGYNVDSHADKKSASKRTNLRALDRYLEDEFGDDEFRRMRDWHIDIEYLIKNEVQSVDTLESWVKAVRASIHKEVQLSKRSH